MVLAISAFQLHCTYEPEKKDCWNTCSTAISYVSICIFVLTASKLLFATFLYICQMEEACCCQATRGSRVVLVSRWNEMVHLHFCRCSAYRCMYDFTLDACHHLIDLTLNTHVVPTKVLSFRERMPRITLKGATIHVIKCLSLSELFPLVLIFRLF